MCFFPYRYGVKAKIATEKVKQAKNTLFKVIVIDERGQI